MQMVKQHVQPYLLGGLLVALVPHSARTEGPPSSPPSPPSLLSRDPRLKKVTKLLAHETSTGRVFAQVFRATTVRLYSDESELQLAPLIVANSALDTAALMDGIAALWLVRWEKDTQKRYKLLVPESVEKSQLPANRYERDRSASAQDFAAGLKKLPPPVRAALAAGNSIPANLLPPDMLRAVHVMTDSVNREHQAPEDDNPFPLSRLAESALRVNAKNRGSYSSYFVSLELPGWGSMGWRITDDKRQRGKPDAATSSANIHAPLKLEVKPKDARGLPALSRKVSISLKEATLPEVLADLYKHYRISFVADPQFAFKQKADVFINDEPLATVLDKLTTLYRGSEWEYRKLGFLVFRSANNPARNAPEDSPDKAVGKDSPPM